MLLSPDTFERFFQQLYWLHGENLDRHRIREFLDHEGRRADLTYAFRTAARAFRMIPDEQQIPIAVEWSGEPNPSRVRSAIAAFRRGHPNRHAFRTLQRSIVTIGQWHVGPLVASGAVEPLHERLFVQADSTLYDDRIGLRLNPSEIRDPEEFVA